ncbi:helix-turn-helix domain-containing protein [Streptomyces sp. NPDC002209]|uniref:helix-turn-helix domain-containing protein n=1 Tax=Streptomyces sp. NPDC002209 TaxID=3364638 RepID=UPI00367D0051
MTASELARKVGATKAQIVAYENGRTVPDPRRVADLARALGVAPSRLMRAERRLVWEVADLRRAAALTAAKTAEAMGMSVKAYRRFEQQGVVPAQRAGFLDVLADLFGAGVDELDRALDNVPAVAERCLRVDELIRELVEVYVHSDEVWSGPGARDRRVERIAALYGRGVQHVRSMLLFELGELRQRSALMWRERAVALYDTDPRRQQRARNSTEQHSRHLERELAQITPRLEGFHRHGQPSGIWQVLVDLHDAEARSAGPWVPLALLAGVDTSMSLPRSLVRCGEFGDVRAAQLTRGGVFHIRSFRRLYAAVYPNLRRPRAAGGQPGHQVPPVRAVPEGQFSLPGVAERFAVPQPVMHRLLEEVEARGTAEKGLSPTVILALGPAPAGSAGGRPRPRTAEAAPPAPTAPPMPDWTVLGLRHPKIADAAQQAVTLAGESEALRRARTARAVVGVLEKHRVGVRSAQIASEAELAESALAPVLAMLCEEEFAVLLAVDTYGPGPALDRLASPGGVGLQLELTLALARDTVGAAVYFARYTDGEVQVLYKADGPVTPGVNEWVDFRAAAHASAVGKSLLTQLSHDMRADHLSRHRTARLTRRTITNPRILTDTLNRVGCDQPVFDLREYANRTVCSAVGANTGNETGSLALAMPLSDAHRLKGATQALARKAVPVLLTLLIAGGIRPEDKPTEPAQDGKPTSSTLTPASLIRLQATFQTPLTTPAEIENAALCPSPGPHLATDSTSTSLYLFAPTPQPESINAEAQLALPHTYTPATSPSTDFTTPHQRTWRGHTTPDRILIFRTHATAPN